MAHFESPPVISPAPGTPHGHAAVKLLTKYKPVCLVITRALNGNVVVYEGVRQQQSDGTWKLTGAQGYWLEIDPAFIRNHQARGHSTVRTELTYIERQQAYGYEAKVHPGGLKLTLSLVACKEQPFRVQVDPATGACRTYAAHSGQPKVEVDEIYVGPGKGLLKRPQYVELISTAGARQLVAGQK